MKDNIVSQEQLVKIEEFISNYFPGTSREDNRNVAMEAKLHGFLKVYARKRGLTLQSTLQHFVVLGME